MTGSEILNGAAVDMFQQHRERIRELYSTTISDVMDRCLDEFLLPFEQSVILQDAAAFTVFIFVIKAVDRAGLHQLTDRKALMQAYRTLNKLIEDDVPKMLMTFVDAAKANEAGEPA